MLGHPLAPATYYVQVRYCHDSDFSGSYYCRATNFTGVRIPSAVAGTLSHPRGDVSVNGKPARDAMTLHYGDEVRTGKDASATVKPSGGGELAVRAGSTPVPASPTTARIRWGKVKADLDRSFAVSRHRTLARAYERSLAFTNTRGTRRTVTVKPGYESIVRGSNPPTKPRRF